MKINKNSVFISCIFILNPLASVLCALRSINKKNLGFVIVLISVLTFFITLYTPPYQDLYRRYISTYYIYNSQTTLWEALENKVDFLFYLCSWLFFKLDFPFYLIPALFSSISCYCILSAANDFWRYDKKNVSRYILLIAFLCIFSIIDVIMIASTLRFGFAVALFIKGISTYYVVGKKKRAYAFFLLATSCHVSMLLPVCVIFVNKFIKISWLNCFILSILMYISRIYLVPFILNIVNLGHLNEYVTTGYINTEYANLSNNTNTLLVQAYKWLIFFVFLIFFIKSRTLFPEFDNYVRLLIVFSAMTALSITIFNRYFIGLISPLVFIGGVSCLSRLSFKPLFQMIIIITLLFNILVINIFLERRQIIMAKMWRGLYLPPAFSLLYSMRDFDNYLKEIDNDGNWVKNRLAE